MKLNDKFDEVLTSGMQTEGFTIEMNRVAFHALIDGIYSDKISAPLRELSTNARDAHVMNGNADQPFEVTLPSRFDPTLRIRDYGCSMTDEFVMSVYKTMFASNKRDSNDVAGAFGLGKMTPLAYSQQFQLTCWLDGRQRSYVIFIGASGIPDIAKVYDEPSDDPQGVEVSFAVKDSDIRLFQEKAVPILQGFDPLPVVTNDSVDLQPLTPIYSGTGWRLVDIPMKGIYARQGGVIYPVDPAQISYEVIGYSSYRWREKISLILDFDIGELSVTTAREALSYDKTTKKNLDGRMRVVVDEFKAIYEAEIAAKSNYLQACIAHSRLSDIANPLVDHLPHGTKLWKDTEVLRRDYHTKGHFGVEVGSTKWDDPKLAYRIGDREYNRSINLDRIFGATFVYTKPDTSKAIQRVRRFLKEHLPTEGSVFWIRTISDLKRLQGFELPITDISELEPLGLPRQTYARGPSAPRKPGMQMWFLRQDTSGVQRETFVATEDTLFVDTLDDNRDNPILLGNPRSQYDLGRMVEYAAQLEIIGKSQKVVFLTERLKERLEVDWKSQLLEVVVEKALKADRRQIIVGLPGIYYNLRRVLDHLLKAERRRDPVLTSILQDYEKWYVKNNQPEALVHLAKAFDKPCKDVSEQVKELRIMERLRERLPLIEHVARDSELDYYLRLEKVIK